jgi:hypothetical protein
MLINTADFRSRRGTSIIVDVRNNNTRIVRRIERSDCRTDTVCGTRNNRNPPAQT